ncbi:hypothetical protein [Engelhardtia mirabilis]|uniref:Uncharacterized protein n=1 Tax=Engelhardtia mirabilis TaxID=2528011 RepID=A0A518BLW9_9BACT|nr:hypothetical protein Pla133_30690 [Planctomycetes bacterium Pla133]QDV02304.1 hypothetical protein Pla86_30680 [Planctomycetes bacterium Pla86]
MFARLLNSSLLALPVLAAGCQSTGTGETGGSPQITPTFDAVPLDQILADTPIRMIPGLCTVGDVDLTGQRVRATLAIELDAGGIFGLNSIQLTDGRFDFTIQTLAPITCTPIQGVTIGPLRVDFELDYQGALANDGGEKCVYASKVEFTQFSLSGIEVLDGVVEAAVKENILAAIDRIHAETLNFAPLSEGADGRCTDWSALE